MGWGGACVREGLGLGLGLGICGTCGNEAGCVRLALMYCCGGGKLVFCGTGYAGHILHMPPSGRRDPALITLSRRNSLFFICFFGPKWDMEGAGIGGKSSVIMGWVVGSGMLSTSRRTCAALACRWNQSSFTKYNGFANLST
ncbi:hypothetical protein P280DRAFT_109889 [Massarina eburnea CBS 473.64]|uniref:Uncharacterized protein n=1 Tax=Massarina eburnea CBS 473.64 TaxID=1395130 RepID=A0A6A6RQZ0_9PLEO|nr:hypothetical protein P280DRAFT_109889 [Massarina eburnea CBS 473.64]